MLPASARERPNNETILAFPAEGASVGVGIGEIGATVEFVPLTGIGE